MIYLHTNLHVPLSNGLVATAIKLKPKHIFRAAAMLLLYTVNSLAHPHRKSFHNPTQSGAISFPHQKFP